MAASQLHAPDNHRIVLADSAITGRQIRTCSRMKLISSAGVVGLIDVPRSSNRFLSSSRPSTPRRSALILLATGSGVPGGAISASQPMASNPGMVSAKVGRFGYLGCRSLVATASGLSSATSDAFSITAGPAAYLLFSVQPSTAVAGATIGPAVRVMAFDGLGNTATGFTGAVTVAITAGTGTGGATLSGTIPVTAVNGIAVFSTLSINLAGSGYTLSATAPGLTGATSTAFSIN